MLTTNLIETLDLHSERKSPTSLLKLAIVGKVIDLGQGDRVVDFGCGSGETLVLWATCFGISGIGIDADEKACARAERLVSERGLEDRIQIVCTDASRYEFESGAFDVAVCIGASMIWGGFRSSLQHMREALDSNGEIVFGEPYYTSTGVPEELIEYEGPFHTEPELFDIANEEDFEIGYVARSNADDWDQYM